MKTKILLVSVVLSIVLFTNLASIRKEKALSLALNNIESLAGGENGDKYKCTATTSCYNIIGQEDGSVSCEGDVCSRGSDWSGKRWVECDGKRTSC